MSLARRILSSYRFFQYKLFGRHKFGTLPAGIQCAHAPFEEDINHGDVVHPCVRYIKDGCIGHKWWMVYTPYYKANEAIENPILCYAESNEPVPPIYWKFFCQVQDQPIKGYNSDPTLLYTGGKLYVMWRENLTQRCDDAKLVRATFCAEVIDTGIDNVFGPLVGTSDFNKDQEISPTFLKGTGGGYRCFSMNVRFNLSWYANLPSSTKKYVRIFFNIADILGISGLQKSYGIAQWSSESDAIYSKYHLSETIKFTNCNKLYRPWHMDIFEYNNRLYAIVQSNQSNADICLAKSEDGIHFRMFSKPLMTNATCGKSGIYKSTGGVVNGMFYLYYTAQDIDNRALNKLYLTSSSFSKITETE